ncbi:MAG: DUF6701 domain-containing protein [Candidatus Omnitrophota bacterium]
MKIKHVIIILIFCLTLFFWGVAFSDSYFEDFDDYQSGVTIDGVQSWVCGQGDADDAVTQNLIISTDSGNALELTGAETIVTVSRSAGYGSVSPCWMEFLVRPGLGGQAAPVPSGKIAAVNFGYTGKIYASSGTSWTDTGKTFSSTEWYRIILKVDFTTHLYDIYIESLSAPEVGFIPEAQNLNFIDSSISSISQVGFDGAYSTTRADDSYVDDVLIHFVSQVSIITSAQTITEGQPSTPITVQLQDSYSVPQTVWRDITLELKSSSEKGEFSVNKDVWMSINQIIIPKDAQFVTFYYKDSKTGKPLITVKEYPDRGWVEDIQQEEIIAKSTYFDISVITPQTAGEYFSITITAKDEDGEVNESYDGQIELFARYINPGFGTMMLIPSNSAGFKKGILELSAMYSDCGIIEIVVRDSEDFSNSGTSGEILFIPASFSVSAQTPQIVNKAFFLTVNALNAVGQLTPNYQGPAGVEPVLVYPAGASLGVITPSILTALNFSSGIAVVSANYDYWGTITIKAYDKAYQVKNGVSSAIQFRPNELLLEVEPPSAERDFFYVGETIEISVSALDILGEAIPNYLENIDVSATMGLGLPSSYQFTAADAGDHVFSVSADSAGKYTMYAEDKTSSLRSETEEIEVKEVMLDVVSTVSPVGTTEVIIRLVDEDGNIISSENSLSVTVELTEENADSTASSSATTVPVTFNKGIAQILVSDNQAEIVTITPQSSYDFKTKKGTVTFGRFTKTGIGTLMWREIKGEKEK